MDAKRLEEIRQWAQGQADWCKGQDLPTDIGGKYADLARCAAAWAKADRLKTEYEYFKRREGLGAFLGIGVRGWADGKSFLQVVEDAHDPPSTAIAAVEAAPEVKP